MFDPTRCHTLIKRFELEAPGQDAAGLLRLYGDFDQAVADMERELHAWDHNLTTAKNLAYQLSDLEDQPMGRSRELYAQLRDAGTPMANYRRLHSSLRRAYALAARLLAACGEREAADEARGNVRRYSGMAAENDVRKLSDNVYPGWFERHRRIDGDDVLAIDYATGNLALLKNGDRSPAVEPLDIEVSGRVEDIIKSDQGWFFIVSKGARVVETDVDFRVRRTIDLDLPPASISRHFVENGTVFACTQFDDRIHVFDRSFKKLKEIVVPGAEELRQPCYKGSTLYVLNFSRSNSGCSELLAIDAMGRVRCVCNGLDMPTSLKGGHGVVAVGDRVGIQFLGGGKDSKARTLYFEDVTSEVEKGPYCNGMEFTDQGLELYMLLLEDFVVARGISQFMVKLPESVV